ncbi:CsgG/HfaB family protein [Marivirga salinae]|uniref:CsgG/HfaB family protein n=1 Tax=Marivirga salinarum TaxID=3059078 RepID=A0AA49GAN6_9BACT|nr:CsgG/HfaB family protein [Marivirga sp. BDSF4-3]WKK74315.2 CsgG/HfaB family protein [Marivirga sp. BDSF4-3]
MKNIPYKYFALIISLVILSSCSNYFYQPMRTKNARLGAETQYYKQLTSLPEPKDKIVAAVYKFRDQTGQYKESETGASWSTAVTQGATSILLRAMEESGWFIPIEREGLSNLLNERKIIRSSRANYTDVKDQLLPPLVFAGIIIEGGIVSFDSNIKTGGAGLRYFGSGSSGQYREDRVTIYLRAVSTSNGRILKTIYTSKTILSQQVDVGVFRFVSLRRLLEAEMGFTYNEPSEMAVKEAIEKAVIGLVIEGIDDQLWQVMDTVDLQGDVINQYKTEQINNNYIDAFGLEVRERRDNWGIGINGSAIKCEGDYVNGETLGAAEIAMEYSPKSAFSVMTNLGVGKISASGGFNSILSYADLGVKYKFLHLNTMTPYIYIGGGTVKELMNDRDSKIEYYQDFYPLGTVEFGFEHLLKNNFGIHGAVNYRHVLSDNLDGLEFGEYDDFFWGVSIGVTKYFSFKKKNKKGGIKKEGLKRKKDVKI